MSDDELRDRERALLEEDLARREAELAAVMDLQRERGYTPRASLMRTPPLGFGESASGADPPMDAQEADRYELVAAAKRPLSSPEDIQETIRRKIRQTAPCRPVGDAPPIGGILTVAPIMGPAEDAVADSDKLCQNGAGCLGLSSSASLFDKIQTAMRGIMEAVRANTSKLNKAEVASIRYLGSEILAAAGTLNIRLIDEEAWLHRAGPGPLLGHTNFQANASAPSREYATVLKTRGKEVPKPPPQGPVMAVYPSDVTAAPKNATETKAALKACVNPAELEIQEDTADYY